MSLIENFEVATNAGDHLDCIRAIISRSKIAPPQEKLLLEKLEKVAWRLNDPDVYVAVVGRANTGKTTFINALLGDELLKSGPAQMTTTTAAFLRYQADITLEIRFKKGALTPIKSVLSAGGNNSMEAEVLSGIDLDATKVLRLSAADEPISIAGFPGLQNLTIRQTIHYLTTTEAVAGQLVSLSITHPSPFLKSGVVIIDAPGFDMSADHDSITKRTVEQADTAIIITPANQPVTSSDLTVYDKFDFLQDFLHRCIFLLTRMDDAVKSERKRTREDTIQLVYNDASKRLKNGLERFRLPQEPLIYACSAQAVVDGFNGVSPQETDAAEWAYWQDEFIKFKKDLSQHMAYQRSVTLAESVLRLLGQLFGIIDLHLSELWNNHHAQAKSLQHVTQDIHVFCEEQLKINHRTSELARNRAASEIEILANREKEQALNDIRTLIYAAGNVDGLKAAAGQIGSRLEKSKKAVEKHLQAQLAKINQETAAFNTQFEKKFKHLYEQLSLLGGGRHTTDKSDFSLPSGSNTFLSNSSMLEDNTGENIVSGAVIGAIIGSVIPIIGTIFGTIVGGVLGSLFGPSLDDRKSAIWNDLESKIHDCFTVLNQDAQGIVESYGLRLENDMESRITRHARKYRNEIDLMRKDQQRKRTELERRQAILEEDMTEIRKRQSQVQVQQQRLRLAKFRKS